MYVFSYEIETIESHKLLTVWGNLPRTTFLHFALIFPVVENAQVLCSGVLNTGLEPKLLLLLTKCRSYVRDRI